MGPREPSPLLGAVLTAPTPLNTLPDGLERGQEGNPEGGLPQGDGYPEKGSLKPNGLSFLSGVNLGPVPPARPPGPQPPQTPALNRKPCCVFSAHARLGGKSHPGPRAPGSGTQEDTVPPRRGGSEGGRADVPRPPPHLRTQEDGAGAAHRAAGRGPRSPGRWWQTSTAVPTVAGPWGTCAVPAPSPRCHGDTRPS